MTELPMRWASHPGDVIEEELALRGWSHRKLAQAMGASESHVTRLCNRHDPVTFRTAIQLEKALGINRRLWLVLQEAYDLNRRLHG